jgi:hypothetical protein
MGFFILVKTMIRDDITKGFFVQAEFLQFINDHTGVFVILQTTALQQDFHMRPIGGIPTDDQDISDLFHPGLGLARKTGPHEQKSHKE